ncbi:MAG: DUF1272 domain-containing protein [Hyphomicrobiaceae bacterium]
MALDLRPNCECCDKDLPAQAADARICSFECTFCADCVETVLHNVCPNCGGGFEHRPVRPTNAWRPGVSLETRPASTKRHAMRFSAEDLAPYIARIKDIPPERR